MTNYDFLYDKNYFAEFITDQHFVKGQLGHKEFENARILPHRLFNGCNVGGVVTQSGEYLESTALHTKSGAAYPYNQNEVVLKNETVIYVGMFVDIWGHCLTDNLRRLWFFKSETYRTQFSDCRIVYVPFQGFQFSESFQQLLQILKIDYKKWIPITEITEYSRIIVPEESFYSPEGSTRYFTEEYRQTIREIEKYQKLHATAVPYDKVYFSYSKYTNGKQVGEEKIERFLRSRDIRLFHLKHFLYLSS